MEFSRLEGVEVRIQFGPGYGQPPTTVFFDHISEPDLGGAPWDDDAAVAELRPVTGRSWYTLDVHKRHGSWGADGAGAEIVVYLANHAVGGVVDVAASAAVYSSLRAIRRTLGRLPESTPQVDRTPEEWAAMGEWRIRAAFRDWVTPDTKLTLVGEERRPDGGWFGTFRDDEGNSYGVEYHPGEPYAARVTRSSSDPGGGDGPEGPEGPR